MTQCFQINKQFLYFKKVCLKDKLFLLKAANLQMFAYNGIILLKKTGWDVYDNNIGCKAEEQS